MLPGLGVGDRGDSLLVPLGATVGGGIPLAEPRLFRGQDSAPQATTVNPGRTDRTGGIRERAKAAPALSSAHGEKLDAAGVCRGPEPRAGQGQLWVQPKRHRQITELCLNITPEDRSRLELPRLSTSQPQQKDGSLSLNAKDPPLLPFPKLKATDAVL